MTDIRQTRVSQVPAVVINLERHRDRLAWFVDQAKRAHIDVETLTAVDASDPINWERIESHRATNSLLSRAELACIISHRCAWQMLVDSHYQHIAVFEDDVHLATDMGEILSQDFSELNADLVKLEVPIGKVCCSKRTQGVIQGRKLHRLLTKAYGSAGYVISRRCAQHLLKATQSCSEPVDAILFGNKPPFSDVFPSFQLTPAACIQDNIVALFHGRLGRFESAIAAASEEEQCNRKAANKRKRKIVSFRKLFSYLYCVRNGAKLIRHKDYVPFDLGPGALD
ncbi:MAG: glycosyltransferase family 25 protein [Propionivibrio sp.]|jgi:glycosyl transferase family 25|nr:glycosyltransferase family 25 protein [Propionivibrio sp.]